MAQPEESFVSLQIYRPVILTPSFLRFLERVNVIGLDIFLPDQTIASQNEEISEELSKPRGIPRHKMYDPETLKVLILDRRAPKDMFSPLSRAYMRLEPLSTLQNGRQSKASVPTGLLEWKKDIARAAAEKGLSSDSLPGVRFSILTLMTNPDYAAKGVDLSLLSEASAESLQLRDESAICFDALRRINQRLAYPTPKTVNDLGFIRLPKSAEPKKIVSFTSHIQDLLPVSITLGPPKVKVGA